ncbi:MAG: hypothetical protein PHC50_05830 [Candidatus Cloacimonetes bacterium]|nr:hypothetical protein [Candidatus Cloacimonadota bacterium]
MRLEKLKAGALIEGIETDEVGCIVIETKVKDETIWLNQKQLAELYQTTIANINMHIRNIFTEGELEPGAVIKDCSY